MPNLMATYRCRWLSIELSLSLSSADKESGEQERHQVLHRVCEKGTESSLHTCAQAGDKGF